MTDAPVLELAALTKRYGPDRAPVLDRLDLVLRRGEYLAVMGESGVGKSTLLNVLCGLDRPSSGRVLLGGVDITQLDDDAVTRLRRSAVGFVFQAFHLLPYLSVEQNVALPLDLLGVREPERGARTARMLESVGLLAERRRFARELSGGELQRVAIARALVHRPSLVLADEPTGNLDSRSAAQTLALLREQVKGHAAAGILITHSPAAAATADRVLMLEDGVLKPPPP